MAENELNSTPVEMSTEYKKPETIVTDTNSLHAKIFGPLGLPEGSIRAIMVICTLLAYLYMVITQDYIPSTFTALVTTMVGWYFLLRPVESKKI